MVRTIAIVLLAAAIPSASRDVITDTQLIGTWRWEGPRDHPMAHNDLRLSHDHHFTLTIRADGKAWLDSAGSWVRRGDTLILHTHWTRRSPHPDTTLSRVRVAGDRFQAESSFGGALHMRRIQ